MIGPGIPNPLMFSGGDPLDELGKIDKSLRFRASAPAYLTRTPGVASNRKTWTWSGWIKRGKLSGGSLFCTNNAGNQAYSNLTFNVNDQIYYLEGTTVPSNPHLATSAAVFRDPASHMHMHVMFDSTQATASLRFRVFINGIEIVMNNAATMPQNFDSNVNTTQPHWLCANIYGGGNYLECNLSNVAFVDGQALTPSSFGQFHPRTGQWRPKSRAAVKAVVDAGGVNSFFLPFDDATSLATLTADASAKGNNWTANNISLTAGVTYDSMLDTPTNNFPVIDPTYAIYGTLAGTISDGNLKFASSSTYHFTPCTIPLPSYGKWQAEFIPQDTVGCIGIADLDNFSGNSAYFASGYGWYGNALWTGNGTQAQTGLATMVANDIVTVTADMDALSMKIYKNGALVCTQALTAGKRYAFAVGDNYAPGATSCYANFGQRAFGYPQTGFKALSTKNLKMPAVAKSESAFVARTDTGANIVATLAAAAPFANWIKIYKRRDAAEGWRWQFSDDAANYMDSSSTAAKAAFPALSGSSYVGYALNVSAGNGIATGRLTHVNGVADVVTDGLATSRKVIILKNESTGSWYFYHPELTAGKLLYLEQTAGETTDSTISAITSTGFTVAAALASGTYRWIALAESDGFMRFGADVGNGSAGGPIERFNLSPGLMIRKATAIGTRWINWDTARNKSNLTNAELYPNFTAAENSAGAIWDIDLLSNGFKLREYTSGDTEFNYPGYKFISLNIAAFPFRYANAR